MLEDAEHLRVTDMWFNKDFLMENIVGIEKNVIEYAPIIICVLVFFMRSKIFITPTQLSDERKEIIKEVENRFLSLVAFHEFEKRVDNNFKGLNRQLEKVDTSLEHIKDILIKKG